MVRKEIKERMDNCLKDYFKEFKYSTQEEAKQIAMNLQVYCYFGDALTEEELLECAEYLGYELNLPNIKKDKAAFLEKMKKQQNAKKEKEYYTKGGKVYVKN